MSEKPYALIVADYLDALGPKFAHPWEKDAAAELRRLHAENERLREALTYDWDQLEACRASLREHMVEIKRLQEELKEDTGVIAVWRGRTERAEAENERLREALKWSLKNGVVYHRTYDTDEVFFSDAGCGCCSSLTEPPPHLQEMILKIARQEKT